VYGGSPELVAGIGRLLPHAIVVGTSARPVDAEGLSWAAVEPPLPFRPASLRGLAVAVPIDPATAVDAARRLARGARLVLDPASPEVVTALRSAGIEILLEQDGVAVASGGGRR
jgi:hypothetical protein